jgi:hypothetical protein
VGQLALLWGVVPLRVGRYSRGLECRPETPGKLKVGRFSRGLERTAEEAPEKEHVGRFSEGREQLPEDAAGKRGIGRFSRGLDHEDAEPPDDPRPPLG